MKSNSPNIEKKSLASEFESNDKRKVNSNDNDTTKDNQGDDDDENPSPNIDGLSLKQLERGEYTPRIRFGYDAIRDMNLRSNSRESNDVGSDEHLNLIKLEHKVSLFPFEGRLDSPFETSSSISE